MSAITHKVRQVVLGGCFLVAGVIVLWTYIAVNISTRTFYLFGGDDVLQQMPVCQHPVLDIDNPLLSKFFKSVPPLDCGGTSRQGDEDWICTRNGVAGVCPLIASKYPKTRCDYTFFDRISDDANRLVKQVFGATKPVDLVTDFFHVTCFDKKNSSHSYKNIMAGVHQNPKVLHRTSFHKLPPKAMSLNILIFGIDSLSRLTFMRKLPLAYDYLTTELGAIVLGGYNIVGDGTPQALIPLLTGKTELELPDTRKRMGDNAKYVDVYPFIWKDFAKHGYVTAFAEDAPSIGTFTYRLKGFDEQPTDHYLRPFYVEFEKIKTEHRKYCIGGLPAHKVLMDWVTEFFDFYDTPKFLFAFHGELSHDDINLIGVADEDLRNFFKSLKQKGHLENTALIVMSDHGHRFAAIRETQQGKQEERLPFFSLTFPPWFKTRYDKAWGNLNLNVERLTTPFDIYSTLKSILRYDADDIGTTKDRSISLMSEVPISRKCEDAGIEAHWCSCLSWEMVSTDNPIVQKAAQKLIEHINKLTVKYRSLCHRLQLGALVRAEKYLPHSDMLHFKKNADADGFQGDFTDNTTVSEVLYQLKVNTEPGDSHFEASVVHKVQKDRFVVSEKGISRVNRYGDAAACIMNVHPDLRKFCHCRQ